MKKTTPPPHLSTAEHGREAPMVISPLRLTRLLLGIARHPRKIAPAHMKELPGNHERLERMEREAGRDWSGVC
jgi:hypothetical protein